MPIVQFKMSHNWIPSHNSKFYCTVTPLLLFTSSSSNKTVKNCWGTDGIWLNKANIISAVIVLRKVRKMTPLISSLQQLLVNICSVDVDINLYFSVISHQNIIKHYIMCVLGNLGFSHLEVVLRGGVWLPLQNKCSGGDFLLSDLGVPFSETEMGSREQDMR